MRASISFDRPDMSRVNEADLAQFIRDALSSWGGAFHPEDPLFHSLEIRSVTIGSKAKFIPSTEPDKRVVMVQAGVSDDKSDR